MAYAAIGGIETYYEIRGEGEPVLMCAPGGFDADSRKWENQGKYAELKFLDHLSKRYQLIIMDRRDTALSGGRVEAVRWADYAHHAKGMLDHLGLQSAHVMGGCMGCSVAAAFGVAYPEATRSLMLYWPVGGAAYRISGHLRFAQHLAYAHQEGLQAVVDLARQPGKAFGKDPRVGPWVSVLQRDAEFAATYAAQNLDDYRLIVSEMARTMLDRDTAPAAEAEQLMRLNIPTLIVPGADSSHATSAARYLQECLAGSDYWDTPVSEQTCEATNAKVLAFFDAVEAARAA